MSERVSRMADRTINLGRLGLRGESYADVARRTGLFGILPDDTDEEVVTKINADAAASAAAAEALIGPTYVSQAAGQAATTTGQGFAVNNGDGTVTIYLRTSGGSTAQRTLATTAYLASSSGAEAVGLQVDGGAPAGTVAAKFQQSPSSPADKPHRSEANDTAKTVSALAATEVNRGMFNDRPYNVTAYSNIRRVPIYGERIVKSMDGGVVPLEYRHFPLKSWGRIHLSKLYTRIEGDGDINIYLLGASGWAPLAGQVYGYIVGNTLTVTSLAPENMPTTTPGYPTIGVTIAGAGITANTMITDITPVGGIKKPGTVGTYTIGGAPQTVGSSGTPILITINSGGGFASFTDNAYLGRDVEPHVMLARYLDRLGIPNKINVYNCAVGGSGINSINMDITKFINSAGNTTDLILLDPGPNDAGDGSTATLEAYIAAVEGRVAAGRAATNGQAGQLGLGLIVPFGSYDPQSNRAQLWFDRLVEPFLGIAEKHNTWWYNGHNLTNGGLGYLAKSPGTVMVEDLNGANAVAYPNGTEFVHRHIGGADLYMTDMVNELAPAGSFTHLLNKRVALLAGPYNGWAPAPASSRQKGAVRKATGTGRYYLDGTLTGSSATLTAGAKIAQLQTTPINYAPPAVVDGWITYVNNVGVPKMVPGHVDNTGAVYIDDDITWGAEIRLNFDWQNA